MSFAVVDCDVHQEVASDEALYPYLSEGWLEYVRGPEPQGTLPLAPSFPNSNPHGFDREDALPPEGGPPGSSLSLMQEQLLDAHGIAHAILTGGYGLYLAGLPNPYFATEVARAVNDHTADQWLSADSRLRGSILLGSQMPEAASAEIHRLADNPAFVQAMLCANPIGHGFGHPIFEPIHRACAECGIALGIHSLGEGVSGSAGAALASGRPTSYFEFHTGAIEGMMTHLMSFIAHGVFERYPSLKLVLLEGGVAWLPAFLRRLDENYRSLRREVPWVRRLPSEYFHDHVRVTTQPFEFTGPEDELLAPAAELGFEDVLLFSSDYPHWDADDLGQCRARLPRSWHDKVFVRNAADLYRLPVAVPA